MSDVIEGRQIENTNSQVANNPQLFTGYETQAQPYQVAANERAQSHIPRIELRESDTGNGANKYGQLSQDMRRTDTAAGATKPGQPTWDLQQDATGRAPAKPAGSPEDAQRTAREKAEKFGFSLDKSKGATGPGQTGQDATSGGQAADGVDRKTPDDVERINKTDPDASEDESAGAADASTADAAQNQPKTFIFGGAEHMEKSEADAKEDESSGEYEGTEYGRQQMNKSEADAKEDGSAGGSAGDGAAAGSGAASGSDGCTADNPRGQKNDEGDAKVKAREEARAAYQSFGLTAPTREFESVRDAVAEANKAIGRRYMARNMDAR